MGPDRGGQNAVRLAISDDHGVVRDGIKFMLSSRDDISVIGEASTSHEALELLRTPPPPDVMLLDLRMAGTSGFDVLAEAADLGVATPIVVMSMHDEPTHVRRALRLGAAGYVLKSSGVDELCRALDTVVHGGRYVQGDLAAVLLDDGEQGATITPREKEILGLVAEGLENKQIGRTLRLSEATVKSYLKNLFARWNVSSRAEAVAIAIRLGIID
jgi:DNA-binding NarL/FixJ family response regulator